MCYVPSVNAGDHWQGKDVFGGHTKYRIFGNPGYSSKPDFIYHNPHNMQAAWIDTYDKGLFQPAYASFNGYSWHSNLGLDTHSLPYVKPRDFEYKEAESVKQVRIASVGNPDDHPIMIASWVFSEQSLIPTDLYYIDLNHGAGSEWKIVSQSYQNKTSFDICYDDRYIYATWLEYTEHEDENWYYQVFASRYSFADSEWKTLEGDIQPANVTATQVTRKPGNKSTPRIEVSTPPPSPGPTPYEAIPYLCWEDNSEIVMGKWNPTSLPASWSNLLGIEVDWKFEFFTKVAPDPSNSSNQPDFKLDSANNPIVVWCIEHGDYDYFGVACSRWTGAQWVDYNSQTGYDFVAITDELGDSSEPAIDLRGPDYKPVISWLQYITEHQTQRSLITIRGNSDFDNLHGNPGFSTISPYNRFAEDCIPFVVPRPPPSSPPRPDAGDILVIGVTRIPVIWFNSSQTDVFVKRFVNIGNVLPTFRKRLFIQAKRWNIGDFGSGWFPVRQPYDYLYYLIDTEGVTDTHVYLRYNTVVSIYFNPHYFDITSIQVRIGDTGAFTSYAPLAQATWLKIPVSIAVNNKIAFSVQHWSPYFPIPDTEPQFYYTEAFTSSGTTDPTDTYDHTYDATAQHDFIGFNVPYSHDFLYVTPDVQFLDRCGPHESFSVQLYSPWGAGVDFNYTLEVDNWDEFPGLYTSFGSDNGLSKEGYVKTYLYVQADCNSPTGWFAPRIKATFTGATGGGSTLYATKEIKVLVRKPILYAKKTANTSMATVGDIVYYTITVGNRGSGSAYDITVTDIMPHDLEFINSNYPGTKVGTNVVFYFPEIPPGTTHKIKIACRIRDDAHIKAGDVITNRATVTGIEKDLTTNMAITIKTATPGCEMPQVEMIIKDMARGSVIRAGQEFDCEMIIHSGCSPFDVAIFWDDGSKTNRFEIGETMNHTLTHTFNDPGDYLIRASISDEYGKLVNLYKHIHVLSAK